MGKIVYILQRPTTANIVKIDLIILLLSKKKNIRLVFQDCKVR